MQNVKTYLCPCCLCFHTTILPTQGSHPCHPGHYCGSGAQEYIREQIRKGSDAGTGCKYERSE